jgi:diphthamide synthase (EF-2-diphthine--ammonia ligase)
MVLKNFCNFQGDEVEDLHRLVERAAGETGAEGVSVGAILSDYQRVRVESVCIRLGLTPLAFLWRRDQARHWEVISRVGKNPGFFKKKPARWVFLVFFLVLLVFFGFYWVFKIWCL